jgi:uncharacterized protein (TIGR00251 family)
MSVTKAVRQVQAIKKLSENLFQIRVHLKPGAKKTFVSEIEEEYVGISISAPPVEGQANTALVNFMADILKCPKRNIELVRGSKSREKVLEVTSSELDSEIILERIKAAQ